MWRHRILARELIITEVIGTTVAAVAAASRWIEGPSGSGRTQALLDLWQAWEPQPEADHPPWLLLAATGDRRQRLSQRLNHLGLGARPHRTATPLGLIRAEVLLHWPQLAPGQIEPLLLSSETEQAMATDLWTDQLPEGSEGRRQRWIRGQLDQLLLLSLAGQELTQHPDPQLRERLQHWCTHLLTQGLISYGLECQLMATRLLPDPAYRRGLTRRFRGVLGDDADEYPRLLLDWLLALRAGGSPIALSVNPDGAVRLGQGADPSYLQQLGRDWERRSLAPTGCGLALPNRPTRLIRQVTRHGALQRLSQAIAQAIRAGEVQASEIAILGPGLDSLGSYLLTRLLAAEGVKACLLSEQRPLQAQAIVRALLSLMVLLVPGLGRELSQAQLAELLTGLSRGSIDPVRASLLARHCFRPGLAHPQLQPYECYDRWDRLSHASLQAYEPLRRWVDEHRDQGDPLALLEAAIARFCPEAELAAEERIALQALEQSARQFFALGDRLGHRDPQASTLAFVQLLRGGAFTADPTPRNAWQPPEDAVVLATVYQYRQNQQRHRWQVWLDVGSPLWGRYGPCLEGFEAYLADPGQLGLDSGGDRRRFEADRLEVVLRDLGARCGEQLILCQSDYSAAGQEQTGPLLPLLAHLPTWEPETESGPQADRP